jgi:hypothetical protein
LFIGLALAGCGAAQPDAVGQAEEPIIGGSIAPGSGYDAVGALASVQPDGSLRQFCSGTLIAPTVVLTAKHCTLKNPADKVRFLIGTSVFNPARVVPVRAFVVENTVTGGFFGKGSDVAIAHLAESVLEVKPYDYATLAHHHVGERFNVLGFGVQDTQERFGTRQMGRYTLRSTKGRILETLFGSVENFIKNGGDLGRQSDTEQQRRELYEQAVLLTPYEAYFGGVKGDVQDCFGDSGGPVVQIIGGRPTVFGVSSWGFPNTKTVCGPGGTYATFGPAALELIEHEVACPQLPAGGACESNNVVTCEGSGRDRFEQGQDCSELDQVCQIDASGKAGCVDKAPAAPPVAQNASAAPRPEDEGQISEQPAQSELEAAQRGFDCCGCHPDRIHCGENILCGRSSRGACQ